MPWPLTAAAVMAPWARGRRRSALITMLMQVCYLRPGEARQLRVEDLLRPGSQSRSWAIVIAPQSRGQVSKTQTSDGTVFIDWPPWFGPVLRVLNEHRADTDYLFSDRAVTTRKEWQEIQQALGVSGACLYQHRHGGASSGVLHRRRPMLEVMMRGRWSSEATLTRSCKAGKLEHLLNPLAVRDREYAL